jgi:ActR/RegA family two-component response regulator
MACGQSVHILLMEDDAGQAERAQRTLERAGYTEE